MPVIGLEGKPKLFNILLELHVHSILSTICDAIFIIDMGNVRRNQFFLQLNLVSIKKHTISYKIMAI